MWVCKGVSLIGWVGGGVLCVCEGGGAGCGVGVGGRSVVCMSL